MTNNEFLHVLEQSFHTYLQTSARSNKKLKILHGAIASDLAEHLKNPHCLIRSLGYGPDPNKEGTILGRYMPKKVDISAYNRDQSPLGAIGVKYIMSNYKQNANNYFENMLGETANLRCNGIACFQIIVLPTKLPYFKKDGVISKIESIKDSYLDKYFQLCSDDSTQYMHTPTLTLLYFINFDNIDLSTIHTKKEYILYFEKHPAKISAYNPSRAFRASVVVNDYEYFIYKVAEYYQSLL